MNIPLVAVATFTLSALTLVMALGKLLRGDNNKQGAGLMAIASLGLILMSISIGAIGPVEGWLADAIGIVGSLIATVSLTFFVRRQKARDGTRVH